VDAKDLLEEAIKVVKDIAEPDWKALALSKIAQVMAQVDRNRAEDLLDDVLKFVRQIRDQSWQLSVLLTVISAFATVDPDQVYQLTMDLPSETTQVLALTDIAESLAQTDKQTALRFLREAERIANKVGDDEGRAEALGAVAEAWALFDVDQALKVAEKIRIVPEKATALAGIARILSDHDKALAKSLAEEAVKLVRQVRGQRGKGQWFWMNW